MNDSPVDCQNCDRLSAESESTHLYIKIISYVLFDFRSGGFEGAVMNDSPVDCQNCDRLSAESESTHLYIKINSYVLLYI